MNWNIAKIYTNENLFWCAKKLKITMKWKNIINIYIYKFEINIIILVYKKLLKNNNN